VSSWAPDLFADIRSGAKFTGYCIFGPNLRSTDNSKAFPSGLKIRGYPVTLVFGGVGSGRLAGIGIQTERGGKTSNRLFYRMDIHKPHKKPQTPNPKKELDSWEEYPFQFHVMRYDKSLTE